MTKSKVCAEPKKQRIRHAVTKSEGIYEGMAHEIPNELLEREIFPITDVVGDAVGRLHIQLKTDFEAADNFLLFVQLPGITIKEKANNFIACEEEDSLYCINGITPE